jgi:Rv0078B-related antitoxin
MPLPASTPEGQRILEACELHDIGLDVLRQRFRRDHPELAADRIEEMVRAWVADRPYDSPGHPVTMSRTSSERGLATLRSSAS